MKNILNIGIFAAASDNVSEEMKFEAHKIGKLIAYFGHNLIYGAGTTGLMRAVVDGYLSMNPRNLPFGSTTRLIDKLENPSKLKQCHKVYSDNMDQRKQLYTLADMIIVLPGGHGTLSELEDFVVYKQLASGGMSQEWDGKLILLESPIANKIIELWDMFLFQKTAPNWRKYIKIWKKDHLMKFFNHHRNKRKNVYFSAKNNNSSSCHGSNDRDDMGC